MVERAQSMSSSTACSSGAPLAVRVQNPAGSYEIQRCMGMGPMHDGNSDILTFPPAKAYMNQAPISGDRDMGPTGLAAGARDRWTVPRSAITDPIRNK
jgi:hypothetical protein